MKPESKTELIRTVCPAHCGIDACGILAHVQSGRVVKVEPAEFPDPKYRRICLRGLSSLEITYHRDRLQHPLKRVGERGSGQFERISWDEALDTIAQKFKDIAAEYGWPAIGWVLGGPGSGTTKFGAYLRLASLTQSTRVSAWGYGDAGLPCGSRVIFGSQFPYAQLFGDFLSGRAKPDVVVVWGANPGESQPLNLMRPIMDAKANGARLVVVDPRFTVTAAKADAFIGLRPGTDCALALALMNIIIDQDLHASDFLTRYSTAPYLVRTDTGMYLRGKDLGFDQEQEYVVWDLESDTAVPRLDQGIQPALDGVYTVNGIACKTAFQLLKELCKQYNPKKAEQITGVSSELIAQLAGRIGRSRQTTFITHMGFTRTYHGDVSLRAMATVATLTGNVMTTFTGGYLPAVLNWKPFLKAIPNKPSYSRMGILQLYDAIISGKPYPVKAVWFSFINFLNQCANSGKIKNQIFKHLDFIVDTELFMTPTARYADIVLPVCSYLEFSDLVPHPYPYIQYQQKAMEPLYECRSDVDIATGLAKRLGMGEYFNEGEEGFIDLLLDSKDASMQGITREKLATQGALPVIKIPDMDQAFDIPFSTPSGKIEIYCEELVSDGQALPVQLDPLETPVAGKQSKYPLAFIQGHSRFRTHSMFANVDSLLKMNPEPVVEMNPQDAADRNIQQGDKVVVFNDRGRTKLKAQLTEGVGPGVINIMQGWWIDQFEAGSVNHLTHDVINPVQEKIYEPNMHMNDVAVEIEKCLK